MSTFGSDEFRWRETYFVLFEKSRRPSLKRVEQTIRALSDRFHLDNMSADAGGAFESLTVLSPDDYAALDVSYIEGDEVVEQSLQLAKEMKNSSLQGADLAKAARLQDFDARFDLMHFEQVMDLGDEADEMLDPSALLIVLDALVELTGGVGIDPQSGALM